MLIRHALDDIYKNNIDVRELYDGLHFSIPNILQWFFICSKHLLPPRCSTVPIQHKHKPIAIKRILKNEDTIWSPIWGIKGLVDVSCEMEVGGQTIQLPVEIKTGAESAVSHNVQVSLYSVMLSQRNEDKDFVLMMDNAELAGLLVYLKSSPFSEKASSSSSLSSNGGGNDGNTRTDQQVYNEIKQELETGARGPYVLNLLRQVKAASEIILCPSLSRNTATTPQSLVIYDRTISQSHFRYMIMRRNLLVAYEEQEKERVKKIQKMYEERKQKQQMMTMMTGGEDRVNQEIDIEDLVG